MLIKPVEWERRSRRDPVDMVRSSLLYDGAVTQIFVFIKSVE
jgi:hypothetical protein